MTLKWIIKASTLIVALVLTLFSIYQLNSKHVPDFFSSLGFTEATQTFNWCTDRVAKMESLSEKKWILFEENLKWKISRDEQPASEMNYLAVEKWFAQYCTVHVKELKSEKIFDLPLTHFAKITYNNGSTANFHFRGGNVYQINQVVFESVEMTEALEALRNLLTINH